MSILQAEIQDRYEITFPSILHCPAIEGWKKTSKSLFVGSDFPFSVTSQTVSMVTIATVKGLNQSKRWPIKSRLYILPRTREANEREGKYNLISSIISM